MLRGSRSRLFYASFAAVVLAGAYLIFELGRYEAGYSMLDHKRTVAALEAQLTAEKAATDDLRRQVAILQTSRDIDRETYARVEANLADLQGRIQSQEEELMFYRSIVSPQDGATTLRVQTLQALPGDGERHYVLRLVLVQAVVHGRRVSGAVKLRLEGTQDGQPKTLEGAELADHDSSADMEYQFRYFQGLECEIALPVGFEPLRVQTEIRPNEARADKVEQTFEWSEIATG